MTKDEDFYRTGKMMKSISDMKAYSQKKKLNYGSLHPPLLDIDIDHVIIDELHLMMRIVDVLIRNLIENAVNLDQQENIGSTQKSSRHLTAIVKAIQSCGVSFSVWENTTKDGKGDSFLKSLEWTSLTGSDMKKLLSDLSTKLLVCEGVPVTAREKLSQLWGDFQILYSIMNAWSPSQEMVRQFFNLGKQWVMHFNSLSHIMEGFDKKHVTPYMHIMVYHVPKLLKTFNGIKQFTGQGVEKCNDDIKMIYHRKSKKHDP